MQYINFKFPAGIKAKCKITNIAGTIVCRSESLNGMLQYALQPPARAGAEKAPDALWVDEANIVPARGQKLASLLKSNKAGFHYPMGDRVKSRINGYTGIIIKRISDLNNCERYSVAGGLDKSDFYGTREHDLNFFAQELEHVDEGLNKKVAAPAAHEDRVKRSVPAKRTGGPSSHEQLVKTAKF